MKQIIFIIIILIAFSNCKNTSKTKSDKLYKALDTIVINDSNSYYEYKDFIQKEKLSHIENCRIDSLKASIDISKNKLIYFIGFKEDYLLPSIDSLPNYLKKNYEINSIFHLSSCLISEYDNYYECYEKQMYNAIEEKYGSNFIEKCINTIDSIYHHKNQNLIYTYNNSYAMDKRNYTQKYNHWRGSIVQNAFENIVLPKGFELTYDSFTTVSSEFIITKNGEIDSLKLSTWNIDKRYESYLKNQLEKYILNTKWKPVEVYGLKINTKEHLSIKL